MKYIHPTLHIVIYSDFAWHPMIDYKNNISDPDIYIAVKFDQLKRLWFIKYSEEEKG